MELLKHFLKVFKAEVEEKSKFVKNYAPRHGKASKLGWSNSDGIVKPITSYEVRNSILIIDISYKYIYKHLQLWGDTCWYICI